MQGVAKRARARQLCREEAKGIDALVEEELVSTHRLQTRSARRAHELCLERGCRTLPIPDNYFDDLEARFDLRPELLDRLRTLNILYDRDDVGEYFQLYSPNYGEGFSFEIVQRRDRYAGYGAPNAPFRIAAQKRMLAKRTAG